MNDKISQRIEDEERGTGEMLQHPEVRRRREKELGIRPHRVATEEEYRQAWREGKEPDRIVYTD